jgi:hypothetical protein
MRGRWFVLVLLVPLLGFLFTGCGKEEGPKAKITGAGDTNLQPAGVAGGGGKQNPHNKAQ